MLLATADYHQVCDSNGTTILNPDPDATYEIRYRCIEDAPSRGRSRSRSREGWGKPDLAEKPDTAENTPDAAGNAIKDEDDAMGEAGLAEKPRSRTPFRSSEVSGSGAA